MATYTVDLKLPSKNIEELIEELRTIGAVESIQFTIESSSKREAVRETNELLNDYSATYHSTYTTSEFRDELNEQMRTNDERPALSMHTVKRPASRKL